MRYDHTLASPRVLEVQPRNTSVRFRLTLLALCTTSIVSGCAGHTGASLTTVRCPNSVHATVSAAKPTVTVSYTEPSVTVVGELLNDLAKTTIYYDLGNGRALAKDVPATQPIGGGQISETITVPVQTQGEQSVLICVTATDRYGNESTMTH